MAEKENVLVSGRGLDPTGRFNMKYNPVKRFFRRTLRNYFIPSLITAGMAVGVFLAFPIFSTALSLTVLNATLIGAGTFAGTAMLCGSASWIGGKLRARSKVKAALRRGGEAQARLFDFMQPETRLDSNGRYHSAPRPVHGMGFTHRCDLIMSYLRNNRNASRDSRFSNIELAQRIIDGDNTRFLADLLVKGAQKGYFGSDAKAFARNRDNRKALKNLKYMTESEADDLLSNMFGVENHFATEGVDNYSTTRVSPTPAATAEDLNDTKLLEQFLAANAGQAQTTKAESNGPALTQSMLQQAYNAGVAYGVDAEYNHRSGLIKKLNDTPVTPQPTVYVAPIEEGAEKAPKEKLTLLPVDAPSSNDVHESLIGGVIIPNEVKTEAVKQPVQEVVPVEVKPVEKAQAEGKKLIKRTNLSKLLTDAAKRTPVCPVR